MKPALAILLFLIGALLSSGRVAAQRLPAIPPSDRILTTEQVKNFWINTLQNTPFPAKPLGLHPELQSAWREKLQCRNEFIQSIWNGERNTDARLAELHHNASAWRRFGDDAKAEEAESTIRAIESYLAGLATYEVQRRAAQSQIDMAERIRSIEAELASLRAECGR